MIPVITRALYNKYVADGTISGGMMPKIENALESVESGVKRVIIPLAAAISDDTQGTTIQINE